MLAPLNIMICTLCIGAADRHDQVRNVGDKSVRAHGRAHIVERECEFERI